jgi:hypothetical protein
MATNTHKFYILTREPSPVGEASSVSITRKKTSKGESEDSTSPKTRYDSTSDTVKEEKVKSKKIKLNPGDKKEESLEGLTVRWTVVHNGKEHTVADMITYKELEILHRTGDSAAVTAYASIAASGQFRAASAVDDFDASINPVTAVLSYSVFISMIHKGINTQLDFINEVSHKRNIAEDFDSEAHIIAINTWARSNLPTNVTVS